MRLQFLHKSVICDWGADRGGDGLNTGMMDARYFPLGGIGFGYFFLVVSLFPSWSYENWLASLLVTSVFSFFFLAVIPLYLLLTA